MIICLCDNYNFLMILMEFLNFKWIWNVLYLKIIVYDNIMIWCYVKRFKFCVINLVGRKILVFLLSLKCYEIMNIIN